MIPSRFELVSYLLSSLLIKGEIRCVRAVIVSSSSLEMLLLPRVRQLLDLL